FKLILGDTTYLMVSMLTASNRSACLAASRLTHQVASVGSSRSAAQVELRLLVCRTVRDHPNRSAPHMHRTKLLQQHLDCGCYLVRCDISGDCAMWYPLIWLIVAVSRQSCVRKLLMEALMQAREMVCECRCQKDNPLGGRKHPKMAESDRE